MEILFHFFSYKTSHFLFLHFGPKLSILMYEKQKCIYKVITKSLQKFVSKSYILVVPGWCSYSKPTRWHAFPITDKRESAGLSEWKNVGLFLFCLFFVGFCVCVCYRFHDKATNNWELLAIKPSRLVSFGSASLIF